MKILSKYLSVKPLTIGLCLICLISLFYSTGCSHFTENDITSPDKCLQTLPRNVKGLELLSGERTQKNIIRDMREPVCQGHALFAKMQYHDSDLQGGSVTFKVAVEYTGEVNFVLIETTDIKSQKFLSKVSGFIMDQDFVYWERKENDIDTVFRYPVNFGRN